MTTKVPSTKELDEMMNPEYRLDDYQRIGNLITGIQREFDGVILGQPGLSGVVTLSIVLGVPALIVGPPGVGKTELGAKAPAVVEGMRFAYVPGQTDTQPSELTGMIDIFGDEPKPVWGPLATANIVFVDEISRCEFAHSALLEALERRKVTILGANGGTVNVQVHFSFIAAMNNVDVRGVKPLGWALRDRFVARVLVGQPDVDTMTEMQDMKVVVSQKADLDDLNEAQSIIRSVRPSKEIRRYIAEIVEATRPEYHMKDKHSLVKMGASPRGVLSTLEVAKFLTVSEGSYDILPKHVRDAAMLTLPHRLILSHYVGDPESDEAKDSIVRRALEIVDEPKTRRDR